MLFSIEKKLLLIKYFLQLNVIISKISNIYIKYIKENYKKTYLNDSYEKVFS